MQTPSSRIFVEDCYRLTISHFGRHLLPRAEKAGSEADKNFVIFHGMSKIEISYRFFKNGEEIGLNMHCKTGTNFFSQAITLDYSFGHYAPRPILLCGCGHRAVTLYLPVGKIDGFACRSCLALKYEATTINKTTKNGLLWYLAARSRKLANDELNIRRWSYGGGLTKQGRNFARQAGRWNTAYEALEKVV